MSPLVTAIILSLVTYRVGRFIILDTLIDEPRDDVERWLAIREHRLVWRKLLDLLGCPYCVTIWVAAATVAIQWALVDSMPAPIWMWLAAAAGSLVVWSVVDSE